MAYDGPIPKRSDQRRRRNKPVDAPVTRLVVYPCGCVHLTGYDSLGRQGWRRCTDHASR